MAFEHGVQVFDMAMACAEHIGLTLEGISDPI